jgi:GTP-binding protein
MSFTVAILGRPNVGKSTLFNRLTKRRSAIVDDTPGVTRDRIEADGSLGDLRFRVIDTAGLDDGAPTSLAGRLRAQSETALAEADLGLLLIDAKAGLTTLDETVADWARRQTKPVVLVANKCEGRAAAAFAAEAWKLGLGPPLELSARTSEGFADLAEAIRAHMPSAEDETPAEASEAGPIRLVVIGRPNVGKSSLINRLIGSERLLTGPEPGLTRDAVRVAWQWRDHSFALIDTAGLRKRPKVQAGLEKLSTRASVEALRLAHVAVLMVDATQPLEMQDVTIAHLVIREGRALVIALNKWDLVDDPAETHALVRDRLETKLSPVKGVAAVPMSVLTGRGVDKLLPAVVSAHTRWERRVPTARLNQWLADALGRHEPPVARGRRIKLRYATQASARPPSFVLFGTQVGRLPESYERFLVNDLRERFDLAGTPIRLALRQADNPYAPKGRARA